jgi:cellulose synthase/poly-beta-1,6-N-acetylglucosamine synthase-like glycosyltransferase/CheY-like chemotaxis protein
MQDMAADDFDRMISSGDGSDWNIDPSELSDSSKNVARLGGKRSKMTFASDVRTAHRGRVLIVSDEPSARHEMIARISAAGYVVDVLASPPLVEARLLASPADLVLVDIQKSLQDCFQCVQSASVSDSENASPIVVLMERSDVANVVHVLDLGASDCIRLPIGTDELLARLQARLGSSAGPPTRGVRGPGPTLLSAERLGDELQREISRSSRSGLMGVIAALDIAERDSIARRLGPRADAEVRYQVAAIVAAETGELDLLGEDDAGRLLVMMPETDRALARERLQRMSELIARSHLTAGGDSVDLTPVVGFVDFSGASATDAVMARSVVAADVALDHLDLQPVEWQPSFGTEHRDSPRVTAGRRSIRARLRTPMQVLITFDIGVVLPFLVYVLLDRAGLNIAPLMYLVVVVALLATATLIWTEGFLAFKPDPLPPEPIAFPSASAIIAAYLPNEAATLIQTVEAFLRMDYPGDFQVVLAYNTPQPMPIEETLAAIHERDPRFVPYRVETSTSKAQNVNAALGVVTGEITGVFDADHLPAPDAFTRAACWLSDDYDVVQGHCAVRNGDSSFVAQLVSVEFEAIYAVSHPGRARLQGFGLFGGSNGYWRTALLRTIRMHGFMLTEDIDSSLRVVESGGRIASDPGLVSHELAPTTLAALWNQRMRWAQGWFQVSRKHLLRGWRSQHMTVRQKTGFTVLLAWREIYPWLSIQVLPLLAFFAWKAGSVTDIDLLVPFFVLTTLFTLSVGPGQTLFAYRLALPEFRRHRAWFLAYLIVSSVFYTEMKNVIGRVAQIKELTGDRQWKVTPRTSIVPRSRNTLDAATDLP